MQSRQQKTYHWKGYSEYSSTCINAYVQHTYNAKTRAWKKVKTSQPAYLDHLHNGGLDMKPETLTVSESASLKDGKELIHMQVIFFHIYQINNKPISIDENNDVPLCCVRACVCVLLGGVIVCVLSVSQWSLCIVYVLGLSEHACKAWAHSAVNVCVCV